MFRLTRASRVGIIGAGRAGLCYGLPHLVMKICPKHIRSRPPALKSDRSSLSARHNYVGFFVSNIFLKNIQIFFSNIF